MIAKFRALNLGDLELGLHDLLEKRKKALAEVKGADLYGPLLKNKLAAIARLPEAQKGGRALVDALDLTESNYAGYGHVLWYMTEAFLHLPDEVQHASQLRADAQQIREQFVPGLGEFHGKRPDMTAAAGRRQGKLDEFKAALQRFPMPGHHTLYDLLKSQLSHGVRLGEQLSERGDLESEEAPSRTPAGRLRSASLGYLNRLRKAVHDEFEDDAELARQHDAALFAYLDQLETIRRSQPTPSHTGVDGTPLVPGSPPGGQSGGTA
jgi:hypothetical protein